MTPHIPDDNNQPHGAEHVRAVLTADQVRAIRRRVRAGEHYPPLAIEYGVVVQTIHKAATGETWRRTVTDEAPIGSVDRRGWTPADDAYLADHPNEPVKAIAVALDRSVSAVKVRRSRLGVIRRA